MTPALRKKILPSRDDLAACLLVVDDDASQRLSIAHFLRQADEVRTEEAGSGAEALARLADTSRPAIDLVLLDYLMPEMDGRETLRRIRAHHAHIPVIILTASEQIEDAVMLMREGASDFITKPFNPERLRLSVEQHLTIRSLRAEVERLKRGNETGYRFCDLIGAEGGLSATIALARKAAASDIPVLLKGESGTGKELLARAIHGESARAARAFVAINCGAIPENLVESTLFGHEKGAFTGAIAREIGKFREAHGGTLLLDEVGELKPDMQTRLLRVLQEREIQPVGAGKPVAVDVRILSATHRNLAEDVRAGRFREDLYYRLNVLPIPLPPLRERVADIPALALHALARFCASERKPALAITPEGMDWLRGHGWAGNVRELQNLLYRAVVLSDGHDLGARDFAAMTQHEPVRHAAGGEAIALHDANGRVRTLAEMEAYFIAWALKRCNNHIGDAAEMLGIGQSTLYKRMK